MWSLVQASPNINCTMYPKISHIQVLQMTKWEWNIPAQKIKFCGRTVSWTLTTSGITPRYYALVHYPLNIKHGQVSILSNKQVYRFSGTDIFKATHCVVYQSKNILAVEVSPLLFWLVLNTSYDFRLHLYFLNSVLYSIKYSLTNISIP